jgi:hypothetical protein
VRGVPARSAAGDQVSGRGSHGGVCVDGVVQKARGRGSSFLTLVCRFCSGGLTGPLRTVRIVLRSCPVMRAISLIVTPRRCISLITNRSPTLSISGLLLTLRLTRPLYRKCGHQAKVGNFRLGSILCWRPDGAVLVTSKCLAQIRLDTVSARSAP